MKQLSLILIVLGLMITSCAKERDPDTLKDPDKEKHSKSTLTITNKVVDNRAVSAKKLWIYKTTVVKTSEGSGFAFVGLQNNARAGYFKFTKDKLQFVNAKSLYPSESENTTRSILNQWDISHHDTKLRESNGKVTNTEIEDDEKTFSQKRFFKIDFSDPDIAESGDFPRFGSRSFKRCWSKKASRILDKSLDISSDYMSFVVEATYQKSVECSSNADWLTNDFIYTVQYRYSFKTLENTPGYKAFKYDGGEFDPLHNKYGYFKTINEKLNRKTGRVEHVHMANRWNPNKDHHFYFVKGFPEEYKWMYNDSVKGIFPRLNKVLANANVKGRFYIHENSGQEFGDIRYSFINFISEIDSSAPLGYGPSDANPFTGEMIAANSMLWTSSLKFYVKRLRDIDANREDTANASLFRKMERFLERGKETWQVPMNFKENMAGDVFHKVMMNNTYGFPYWNTFTSVNPRSVKVFNKRDKDDFDHLLKRSNVGLHSNFSDFNDSMESAIPTPEDLSQEIIQQKDGHCLYSVEDALAGVPDAITEGRTDKEIIDAILYQTSIHEFGHNLSLRHNFYGSVDSKNWSAPSAKTSSVMEYLDLEDELDIDFNWGSYDQAALQYLFTDGKVDSKKFHLFCTDEHRALNAMCNVWDSGTTPTEIISNMIEDYEKLYFILNYRYERAYWGDSYYSGRAFSTMWNIKKFLGMWRTDFSDDKLDEYFKNRFDLSKDQKDDLKKEINAQFYKAVELSVAFYDGVIQQAASDRPWRNEYDNRTGALTRIGILFDKIFATRFLIGDEGFMYNPSNSFNNISYLSFTDIPEIRVPIEKAFENSLTTRVDMDTWFLDYSRSLYAFNSTNYANSFDNSLSNRIRVVKMSAEELRDDLGLDLTSLQDSGTFVVSVATSPDFKLGSNVGFTKVNGSYYLAEQFSSPYAFNIIQKIIESFGDNNVNRQKRDLVGLHNMYNYVSQ